MSRRRPLPPPDILGGKLFDLFTGDALAWMRTLPDKAVTLWITSPPYEDARRYSTGHKLRGERWVEWYRPFVVEMCRTSTIAAVNVSAVRRKWVYSGAVEMLVADLMRLDGIACVTAPYAWVKNGIPGSGSGRVHRRDWEPVYLFALPDRLENYWSDPLAFGSPPVYGPGGPMSNRQSNGKRVGANRRQGTGKNQSEEAVYRSRPLPAIADPGNVIATSNGGNNTGESKLVHQGQAPMNLAIAERFTCWFAPPASIVGDPMTGTGTTGVAALRWGRRFLGADEDPAQIAITRTRLATVRQLGEKPYVRMGETREPAESLRGRREPARR